MRSYLIKSSFILLGLLIISPLSAQYVFLFDSPSKRTKIINPKYNPVDLIHSAPDIVPSDPSLIELGLSNDQGVGTLSTNSAGRSPALTNFLKFNNGAPIKGGFTLPTIDNDHSKNKTQTIQNPQLKDNIATSRSRELLPHKVDYKFPNQISRFLEDFFKIEKNESKPSHFSFRVDHQFIGNHYQYFEEVQNLPNALSDQGSHYSYLALTHSIPSHVAENETDNRSEFTFNEKSLFSTYPDFSSVYDESPKFTFNAFSKNPFSPLTDRTINAPQAISTESSVSNFRSNRQRRVNWSQHTTYNWEINDFDPTNEADNLIGTTDDNLTNFTSQPGSKQVKLNITANNGIESLAVLAYGTTGGNALNDYDGTDGFRFMRATGYSASTGDRTDDFSITIYSSSGIGNWLNGYDSTNAWGVWYDNGTNDFYLTYQFSNLNFSPVPEPSTYFMTGALFCLIGCNRASRRSLKKLVFHFFKKTSTKENCTEVENQSS